MDSSKINEALSRLGNEYLSSLDEIVEELEARILDLETIDDFIGELNEIARKVHSIKGSGGSYGFTILTTICHQFEDRLTSTIKQQARPLDEDISSYLSYLDILNKAVTALQKEDISEKELADELKEIHNSLGTPAEPAAKTVLVADNSKTSFLMIKNEFENSNVSLSFCSDGYEALGRLLNESFDAFICVRNLKTLPADAIIAALKISEKTKDLKTILLTTDTYNAIDPKYVPDHTITRKLNYVQDIKSTIDSL